MHKIFNKKNIYSCWILTLLHPPQPSRTLPHTPAPFCTLLHSPAPFHTLLHSFTSFQTFQKKVVTESGDGNWETFLKAVPRRSCYHLAVATLKIWLKLKSDQLILRAQPYSQENCCQNGWIGSASQLVGQKSMLNFNFIHIFLRIASSRFKDYCQILPRIFWVFAAVKNTVCCVNSSNHNHNKSGHVRINTKK